MKSWKDIKNGIKALTSDEKNKIGRESKEYAKNQEKRMTDGMSTELVFVPQCCDCVYNKEINACKKFKVKPMEYMTNTEKCPEMNPGESDKGIKS